MIFQNLEYILVDATKFLSSLTERMKFWSVNCCIGDLFEALTDEVCRLSIVFLLIILFVYWLCCKYQRYVQMAAYQQYVNHCQRSMDAFKVHIKKKTSFFDHWSVVLNVFWLYN